MNAAIDPNLLIANMRRAGLGHIVDAAGEGVETLCHIAGFQRVPAPALTAATLPTATLLSTTPPANPPLLPECTDLMNLIRAQYFANCGFCPNPCLLRWLELAVLIKSYPEVRDDFGIPDLSLVTTGLTPTGVSANGQATIFDANFNVAPGHSILLRTQNYSLPFNPRCLWGALAFSGGIDSENYKHVNFKVWVGPTDTTGAFNLQTGPLREWNPRRFIYGSEFRCGDSCSEIPLRSYTGCTDIDIVGLESSIFIQVDNLVTATNNITGQQMVVRLGGFEKPCCDSCAVGKPCSSSCKGKH